MGPSPTIYTYTPVTYLYISKSLFSLFDYERDIDPDVLERETKRE